MMFWCGIRSASTQTHHHFPIQRSRSLSTRAFCCRRKQID
ncbi:unnamed protein product, partial [Musa banksii]